MRSSASPTSASARTAFAARSVPYPEVAQYYAAADCFVLASLCEGFGRVFLEALAHGLPVIAHEHPVMRYVLGEHGILADLSLEGALARDLREVLARPADGHAMRQRWQSVRRRFDWAALAPAIGACSSTRRTLRSHRSPASGLPPARVGCLIERGDGPTAIRHRAPGDYGAPDRAARSTAAGHDEKRRSSSGNRGHRPHARRGMSNYCL